MAVQANSPATTKPPVAKPPYDTVKEAYAHLQREDKYQPYEPRDDGDWVVVLFTETLACRLFRRLEDVGKRYSWDTYRHAVYIKPEQLAAKISTAKLIACNEKAQLDVKGKTGIELAKQLWAWAQANGDRILGEGNGAKSAAEEVDKYKIRVDLLKDPEMQGLIKTLPKQARIIAEQLGLEETSAYTEDELVAFARRLVGTGKMKTKQDPFRVVAYYLPTLADMGLASYPSRRAKRDERGDDVAA